MNTAEMQASISEEVNETAQDIIGLYKELKKKKEQIEKEMENLRLDAKSLLAAAKTTKIKTEEGTISWIESSETHSYDKKGLDAICQYDPAMEAALSPHRKSVALKSYVKIV